MRSIPRRTVYPFSHCFDIAYEEVRDLYGRLQHMHVVQLFHHSLQSDHRMDVDKSYHLRYGQKAYQDALAHKQLLVLHGTYIRLRLGHQANRNL